MKQKDFLSRHIGPGAEETKTMLQTMGLNSVDQLIDETIPPAIRLKNPLQLEDGMSEYDYLNHIRSIAKKNKVYKSYIGMGYYNTVVPSVILRNVFENPGWYTSYTPYQAEISQGRLEALLNFQTMISDLTGLPLANASLLDEGTAAAEAMLMFFHARPRALVKAGADRFLVSSEMFPQTLDVLKIRANSRGINLVICEEKDFDFTEDTFGCMLQYPDQKGAVRDYSEIIARANEHNVPVAVAADLMSLALLTPPGEWGAQVVFGNSQRFGVPLGYGGPHAAFFATTEEYKRVIPGRIIGISKDVNGNDAYRMALQTREQHIKRERATSNICTAQALLAIMSGFYGVYHGKDGIKQIAGKIHMLTAGLDKAVRKLNYQQLNKYFFDTWYIRIPDGISRETIRETALKNGVNFRYFDDGNHLGISIDETTSENDVALIVAILAKAAGKETFELKFEPFEGSNSEYIPENFRHSPVYSSRPGKRIPENY